MALKITTIIKDEWSTPDASIKYPNIWITLDYLESTLSIWRIYTMAVEIAEVNIDVPQIIEDIIVQSEALDRSLYHPDSTVLHIYKEFGPQLGMTHFNVLALWIKTRKQVPYNYTIMPEDYIQYSIDDDIYAHIYVILNIMNSTWSIALEHDERFAKDEDKRKRVCAKLPKMTTVTYKSWAEYDKFLDQLREALTIIQEEL